MWASKINSKITSGMTSCLWFDVFPYGGCGGHKGEMVRELPVRCSRGTDPAKVLHVAWGSRPYRAKRLMVR
jgi:hypothetical protein